MQVTEHLRAHGIEGVELVQCPGYYRAGLGFPLVARDLLARNLSAAGHNARVADRWEGFLVPEKLADLMLDMRCWEWIVGFLSSLRGQPRDNGGSCHDVARSH